MNIKALRDFIVRTVWDLLGPARGSHTAASSSSSQPQTNLTASPQRVTQQALFSLPKIGILARNYVGRFDDDPSDKLGASLLYRSRGGEVIRSFVLSRAVSDGSTWTIALVYSVGGIRTTLTAFSPPVTITVNDGSPELEIFPNVELPPNSGLYAQLLDGPVPDEGSPNRLDGIVEIERNATI